LFSATCFAHLAIASHTGLAIYLLRISYCCAIAGIYGGSMTFVSSRTPDQRMAELIGMLGTAGFTGTVLGSLLGDFLLGSASIDATQVSWMFVAAGSVGLLACPLAWLAVRREKPPSRHPGPSVWTVLRHHSPGAVLVVGVAMGLGLGLPQTFLRTYAAELGIPRIGLFFLVYAGAAVITRILTRRWPERFGTRAIIIAGMAGAGLSMALFLSVGHEWQLIVPAVGFGCAHAVLFPAVVAAGSVAFPARNRGLATLLVLAAWDLGQVIGAPTVGVLLRYTELAGLPPYPTMFVIIAGLLMMVSLWYAACGRETAAAEPSESA
jgi:MFS family permease